MVLNQFDINKKYPSCGSYDPQLGIYPDFLLQILVSFPLRDTQLVRAWDHPSLQPLLNFPLYL